MSLRPGTRAVLLCVLGTVVALTTAGCSAVPVTHSDGPNAAHATSRAVAAKRQVCGNTVAGPSSPPEGAVVVRPGGSCTLVLGADSTELCVQPGISHEPLYDDCRWKTKRVDIHDNVFIHDPAVVGRSEFAGRMAVLSNYGTHPDWSPYQGTGIQEAITFSQHNRWHDNTCVGPWSFVAYGTARTLSRSQWQAPPYSQDRGSTFEPLPDGGSC